MIKRAWAPLCSIAEELSWAEEGKHDRIAVKTGQPVRLGSTIFVTVP